MNKKEKLLGSLSIITATMIYGFFSILARIIGYSIPIFYQNWTRSIFATCILIALLLFIQKSWKRLTKREFIWIWLRSLMGSAAFLQFFYCVNNMQIGTTYFLFYGGSTVVGYMLGKLLFNERMNIIKWISMILATMGLFLIYTINFTNTSILLVLIALGSGATTAFWNVSIKKINTVPSIQLTFLDNALTIPLYIVLSIITKEILTAPAWNTVWIASFGYGLLFVMTGQLIIYGFNRLEAQIGSIIMLAEVPIAILLGFLVYKETITLSTTIGGLFILSAILIPEIIMLRTRK